MEVNDRACTCAYLAVLALLAWGEPADAQSSGAAQHHVEQGERFYRLSDYPAALRQYEAAYRLDPRPALLFNVARCHEVMANLELAIRYYRRYLRRTPEAKDRAIVEQRIRNLRKRLATSRPDEPAPQQPRDRPTVRARWLAPTGWSLVGVGAALLVTGIVFGVMAERKADDYTAAVGAKLTYAVLSEFERSGERFERVQIGTLIAGGLVAAAGGVFLLWDWRDRKRARRRLAAGSLSVRPLVGRLGLGLVAEGRF